MLGYNKEVRDLAPRIEYHENFCPPVPRALTACYVAEYQQAENAGVRQVLAIDYLEKLIHSFPKIHYLTFKMDIDDEELPPLLVDTKTGAQDPEDGFRVRVPITIVTGKH